MIYVLAGAPHHGQNLMLVLGVPASRYNVVPHPQTVRGLGRQDVLFIETDSASAMPSLLSFEREIAQRKLFGLQVCTLSLGRLLGDYR